MIISVKFYENLMKTVVHVDHISRSARTDNPAMNILMSPTYTPHHGHCCKVWWKSNENLDRQTKVLKADCPAKNILMSHTATSHFCEDLWKSNNKNSVEDGVAPAKIGSDTSCKLSPAQWDDPAGSATFVCGDWSWNIFYDHFHPSADSRRAVVSF